MGSSGFALVAIAEAGCGCFRGDTPVDTPHDAVAIVALHLGDLIETENPPSGMVETEPMLALIDDGVQPLMAVGLSDGSSLAVTTNHPFYVDTGPARDQPGWVPAGQVQVGDRLRTADGQALAVITHRYYQGTAHVYTPPWLAITPSGMKAEQETAVTTFLSGPLGSMVHDSNGPCLDLLDLLMPDGKPIGVQWSGKIVLEAPGGTKAAQALICQLEQGGKDVTPPGTRNAIVDGQISKEAGRNADASSASTAS